MATLLPPGSWRDRFWRTLATAWCFSLFGLGGLVILCLVFPLLLLLVPYRARRQKIARHLVRQTFRFFCWMMEAVGVMRFTCRGLEKLNRQGMLVVANHPSLIDVVILISLLDSANCVVKAGAWKNPFMVGPIRMCGFIRNNDGSKLVEACIDSLNRGDNLIIFPEGTRTLPAAQLAGEVNPLRRGVAQIAVRGHFSLTPVIITVSEPLLTKQSRWYQIPRRRGEFALTVLDDVPVDVFVPETMTAAQAARRYTESLTNFLNGAIKKHV